MAAIETSSFQKSDYNCPTKKPKYSNISSRSSDLYARSSPEFQVEGKLFCMYATLKSVSVSFQANLHVVINRTDCGSI